MRRFAALLVIWLLVLSAPRGRAEDDLPHRTMPFALRDTNAARYAVQEARRELAAGRIEAGLVRAQRVLDAMPDDLYRVASPEESTRWRLASAEVSELLAGLSAEGRATYERLVAPLAAPLIERALQHRDLLLLEDVARRYGASSPGLEAARLLAGTYLEQGRSHDAVAWADEGLLFFPSDPWLAVHRIEGLGLAGDRDALQALAAALPPGELHARAAAWLDRIPVASPPQGWPMLGGDARRSRVPASPGPRPQELRWRSVVPLGTRYQDLERAAMNSPDDGRQFWEGWKSWRPLHPAVDERVVYVGNGRAIYAYDLYSDQLRWAFEEAGDAPLPLLPARRRGDGRTSFERVFAPVVGDALVFGTVELGRSYSPEILNMVEISTYLPQRVLVALDKTTGALQWVMGNRPVDRLALSGFSIVSPCVLEGDSVYAVASQHTGTHHSIAAVAFDATTGHLRWKRDLGLGQQELNLFGAPVKELAAAAPAVADDVLYLTSGLGFAAALDARTGVPRWVASYEIQPIQQVQYWYRAPLRFPDVAPSPVTIAGDAVLIAPTDGRHLHAFERATGALRWRVRYPLHPLLGAPAQFMGVANDGRHDVALMTGNHLVAFDVATGKPAWIGRLQGEFGEQNVPVGRGIVAGDVVLVPTNQGLSRFSLSREGSFLGRDPWPSGSSPGNVLPTSRVLLVTGRDAVQGFYSWDVIEQDLESRRRIRPDDPLVFVEAGEIYRAGGALDRARAAFEAALGLADRSPDAPTARARAEQGLHRTWLAVAEQEASRRPAAATEALRESLRWARRPREKVEARLRLDRLLEANPDARVANLRELVAESAGVNAAFEGIDGEAPVRAVALLRLAGLLVDQGAPADAVVALQQILREETHAAIAGKPAGELAQARIDEIIEAWGPAPYAPFEEKARRMLDEAAAHEDTALLGRILREFPNAGIVPETLYQLGHRHLEDGEPRQAIGHLQELLARHARNPRIAQAAAELARAYAAADDPGAASFLLAWIDHRVPDAVVEVEGETLTGAAYVARERAKQPVEATFGPLGPRRLGEGPLREVLVVEATGNWGNQVLTTTHPGAESPLALFRDGDRLVGLDLPNGRVAFDMEEVGPVHRAHVQDGVAVLAFPDGLTGVSARDGTRQWEVRVDGSVTSLAGAHGLVFALRQDTSGNTRNRTLLAFDVRRGNEIWRRELGDDDYRELQPHGTDILIRQSRYESGQVWPSMLLYDGATGTLRQVFDLPESERRRITPVVADGTLITSASEPLRPTILTAREIETGHLLWTQRLPGTSDLVAMLAAEEELVCLQADGTLTAFATTDGTPRSRTRIYAGGSRDVRPFHGTLPLARDGRLVMLPLQSEAPFHLGAWNRTTGKLDHEFEWTSPTRPLRAILADTDDAILFLLAETNAGEPVRVVLRRIDPATGAVLQEIESLGLRAENGFLDLASGWGSVVVFGRSRAVLYRTETEAR